MVVQTNRNNLIETIEAKKALASTAYGFGIWLQNNGSGYVIPLTKTNKVSGLCLDLIQTTDANYAQDKEIWVDTVIDTVDRFLMPVTDGTATAAMVGSFFDIDSANPAGLDVSAGGTQFEVMRFISASVVEVRVALLG